MSLVTTSFSEYILLGCCQIPKDNGRPLFLHRTETRFRNVSSKSMSQAAKPSQSQKHSIKLTHQSESNGVKHLLVGFLDWTKCTLLPLQPFCQACTLAICPCTGTMRKGGNDLAQCPAKYTWHHPLIPSQFSLGGLMPICLPRLMNARKPKPSKPKKTLCKRPAGKCPEKKQFFAQLEVSRF